MMKYVLLLAMAMLLSVSAAVADDSLGETLVVKYLQMKKTLKSVETNASTFFEQVEHGQMGTEYLASLSQADMTESDALYSTAKKGLVAAFAKGFEAIEFCFDGKSCQYNIDVASELINNSVDKFKAWRMLQCVKDNKAISQWASKLAMTMKILAVSEIRFHGDAKNPTPDATDTQHIQVTGSVNPDEVIYGEKTGEGKEEL